MNTWSHRAVALILSFIMAGLWVPDAAAQIYALPRPDTIDTQSFGVSVAIHGNVAVVGASGEAVCGANSGAAYVYRRDETDGPWARVARLEPSECRENAFFGGTVGVHGDRIIVSASSEFFAAEKSNAAYVFEYDAVDSTWTEAARLTGIVGEQEGVFAADVAIQNDRAVVTTAGSVDGTYGGSVYVFDYDAERDFWRRTARLSASRGVEAGVLGGTVALDGDRIAVAASTYFQREPGSVYVFERDPASGEWRESAILPGVEDFFISLSLDDDTLVVGESRAGRKDSGVATIFVDRGDTWEETTVLTPSTPYESGAFGSTVSTDDGWALITGYDEQLGQDFNIDRVVYAFRKGDDGSWAQRTIIDIGEVAFGASIDQDGPTAIISAVPETAPGAVYVVRLR